ncbi:MAG: hypothetical protein KDB22_20570 [Planctomycetales bacterium]|nr:hypothetical protein [Planctomycetales bacterium]
MTLTNLDAQVARRQDTTKSGVAIFVGRHTDRNGRPGYSVSYQIEIGEHREFWHSEELAIPLLRLADARIAQVQNEVCLSRSQIEHLQTAVMLEARQLRRRAAEILAMEGAITKEGKLGREAAQAIEHLELSKKDGLLAEESMFSKVLNTMLANPSWACTDF